MLPMRIDKIVIKDTARIEVGLLAMIDKAPLRRSPGNDAGKVVIKPDFDEPLPKFEE
jgi:hypothetical protein